MKRIARWSWKLGMKQRSERLDEREEYCINQIQQEAVISLSSVQHTVLWAWKHLEKHFQPEPLYLNDTEVFRLKWRMKENVSNVQILKLGILILLLRITTNCFWKSLWCTGIKCGEKQYKGLLWFVVSKKGLLRTWPFEVNATKQKVHVYYVVRRGVLLNLFMSTHILFTL